MNFDFSDEQDMLRETARRLLADACPPAAVRAVIDAGADHDAALWAQVCEMGFAGAAIPEAYGGLGLGALELCVIAEELGRVLAPVPFLSTVLAAHALTAWGSEEQRLRWLPDLAAGGAIGTVAFADGVRHAGGRLSGTAPAAAHGMAAAVLVVAAADGIFLVAADGAGVTRQPVATIDPTCGHARIAFTQAPCEVIAGPAEAAALRDHAAVLMAFSQLGGADRALDMACDHARERMAFGRPIGSFQAIKHMLADMYVAVVLARSNCLRAAWALSADAGELPAAAAAARLSASEAYRLSARQMIHVHGGMGFTWEADCHLHYRRANRLAVALGGAAYWEDRLIDQLRAGRGS